MPIAALALACLIVGVSDSETLTARCPTTDAAHPYQQVKVRLAEIDAPEKGQPSGRRSKQHMSHLCYRAEASIRQTTRDRYGRTVARVTCRGLDANLEQVRAGMAWAYTKYQTDAAFPRAEQQARRARVGLWSDRNPVPPWEFRSRPQPLQSDASGCITGPRGGRHRLMPNGRKRYGC